MRDYVAPPVKILSGTVTTLYGKCGILRIIAREQFDDDFVIVPKGGEAPSGAFLKDRRAKDLLPCQYHSA